MKYERLHQADQWSPDICQERRQVQGDGGDCGFQMFLFLNVIERLLQVAISSRVVQKEYVARVVGQFPEGLVSCLEPLEVGHHDFNFALDTNYDPDC